MTYFQIAVAGAVINALVAIGTLSWVNALVAALIALVTWIEARSEDSAFIAAARARSENKARPSKSNRT